MRERDTEKIWHEERLMAHARHAVRMARPGEHEIERVLLAKIELLERERDEAIRQRDLMLARSEELILKFTMGKED